ncbi:T9SS type A sorting domain-containing protein [Ochrovirga pacifica]|uniref:T9SS type A sorting domain-containing protein n=1 Tax=Ochrovirga pacifica TaxID=1042376 RepID=UPI000255A555|nr:T9SS type A sorting domain-containing protein [Ochrovirga pacifica]
MKKTTKKLISFGVLLISSITFSANIYVSASGDNTDGTTLATAYTTINTAYNEAKGNAEDDNIIIDGTVVLSAQITINDTSGNSITFVSADDGFGGTQGIINGGGTNRLFFVNASSASSVTVFTGLQFENVTNTLGQGALMGSNSSSSMTFNSCTFSNNIASNPSSANANGVISVLGLTMTFTDCVFDSNSTTNGNGGMFFVGNNGSLVLNRCLFKNNSSSKLSLTNTNGGAISIVGTGSSTITNTTFYNNSSELQGGAIYVGAQASITMTNVTMFQNSITDSNTGRGAGLRLEGSGSYTLSNVLSYGNTADGVASDLGCAANKTINMNNSIFGATPIPENVTVNGVNNSLTSDLSASALTFNSTDGVVKFSSVATGTDSPIDFGDSTYLTVLEDQNGDSRPSGSIDAGAWESSLTLSLDGFEFSDNIGGFYKTTNGYKIVVKKEAEAELYNFLGAKVDSFIVKESYDILDSKYAAGVYILKVTIEGLPYAKKFIIK